jgi:hypothetical protein
MRMVWKKWLRKVALFFLKISLDAAWNVVDKNKDGKISKTEAKEFWDLVKKYFRL